MMYEVLNIIYKIPFFYSITQALLGQLFLPNRSGLASAATEYPSIKTGLLTSKVSGRWGTLTVTSGWDWRRFIR